MGRTTLYTVYLKILIYFQCITLLLPATFLRARTNRDRPSPLAADQSQQVKDILHPLYISRLTEEFDNSTREPSLEGQEEGPVDHSLSLQSVESLPQEDSRQDFKQGSP